MQIGVGSVDVTPPPGLEMIGFVARKFPATNAHDRLTARALVVDDTALLIVDALGLAGEFSQRVRSALPLPEGNVIIHATHTHGGPNTMPGRLYPAPDSAYLSFLEKACAQAVKQALEGARPGSLSLVRGKDPDVARNRRRPDGPVDKSLMMLIARDESRRPLACLVNYACHPVVLGADNLLWTADYPHFVRQELEARYQGATAMFLTGCVGDLNPGHSAASSLSARPQQGRDFATAKLIGNKVAAALLEQEEEPLLDGASVRNAEIEMGFNRRECGSLLDLAKNWRDEAKAAKTAQADLLFCWADWAERMENLPLTPSRGRVSVLKWGRLTLVAMPGEIFAETAFSLRQLIRGEHLMLAGFCEDNPGYIPPASEFQHGGYEVDEAHRYYGQPASFAPGTAEAIASCAVRLA